MTRKVDDLPLFVRPEWYDRANCHGVGADLFYSERGEAVANAAAVAVCAGCEVRVECLALALDRGEGWGVWGGMSVSQRRRVRRRRVG